MADDDLKLVEARETRRRRRLNLSTTVMWLALMAGVTVLLGLWRGWMPEGAAATIILAGLAGIVLAAAAIAIRFAPGADARRLNAAGGRRDREQRMRTAQLTALPASMLILMVVASGNVQRFLDGDRDMAALLMAIFAPLFVILLPAMVMGWDGAARKAKRYLEDELTREFRARAIISAFWVLLLGGCGIYLLGLWRPEAAVSTLPLVLWAGGATAAFRFAHLHQQAEQDG